MRFRRNPIEAITRGRTPLEALGVLVAIVLFVGTCGYAFFHCYSGSYDYDLQLANRVLNEMMGEETLQEAGFFDTHPEATPSAFVEFIDDSPGDDLWPPTRRQFQSDLHPGADDDPGRTLHPADVVFVTDEPDPDEGKQLVYIPDDDAGEMHVEAYLSPDDDPLYTWTHSFPTDADPIDP